MQAKMIFSLLLLLSLTEYIKTQGCYDDGDCCDCAGAVDCCDGCCDYEYAYKEPRVTIGVGIGNRTEPAGVPAPENAPGSTARSIQAKGAKPRTGSKNLHARDDQQSTESNDNSDNPNSASDNPNSASDKPNTASDKANSASDKSNYASDKTISASENPNTASDDSKMRKKVSKERGEDIKSPNDVEHEDMKRYPLLAILRPAEPAGEVISTSPTTIVFQNLPKMFTKVHEKPQDIKDSKNSFFGLNKRMNIENWSWLKP